MEVHMRYTQKIKDKYILKNTKSAQEKNLLKLGQLEDLLDKYECKDAKALNNLIESLISSLGNYKSDIEKYKNALIKKDIKTNKSIGTSIFREDKWKEEK